MSQNGEERTNLAPAGPDEENPSKETTKDKEPPQDREGCNEIQSVGSSHMDNQKEERSDTSKTNGKSAIESTLELSSNEDDDEDEDEEDEESPDPKRTKRNNDDDQQATKNNGSSSNPQTTTTKSDGRIDSHGSNRRKRGPETGVSYRGRSKRSLSDEVEKEILTFILNFPDKDSDFTAFCNQKPSLLGTLSSDFRKQVRMRRRYLLIIRANKPKKFLEICAAYGLVARRQDKLQSLPQTAVRPFPSGTPYLFPPQVATLRPFGTEHLPGYLYPTPYFAPQTLLPPERMNIGSPPLAEPRAPTGPRSLRTYTETSFSLLLDMSFGTIQRNMLISFLTFLPLFIGFILSARSNGRI